MTTEIEGIWKHGKIVPLEDIEVEENTKVIISISIPVKKKSKKSLMEFAGVWKDDDETYNLFKKVYGEREQFKLRK